MDNTVKTKSVVSVFGFKVFEIEKTVVTHGGVEITAPPAPTVTDFMKKNYMGEVRPDLKDLEIKAGISKPPEKHELATCSTCNGVTHDVDIRKCEECGKEICGNCGSYDDITKKNLCETCWEKI